MQEPTISQLKWTDASVDQLSMPAPNSLLLCSVSLTRAGKSVLSDSQRLRAVEMLSDIQWDRYERRQGTASDTYLTGRYYLLCLIGQLTGQTAEQVQLSYNRLNKPFLQPNPLGLEFNFTDTTTRHDGVEQSFGLFAFCLNEHVGVDLEMPDRAAATSKIATRRFTADELEFAKCDDENTAAQRFLQVWTRKEAFGKACGVGINFKMNALNLLNPSEPTFRFENRDQHWCLHQFLGPNQEIACVVHSGTAHKTLTAVKIQTEL